MNLRIFLCVLIFSSGLSAQIPNYSFENWTNSNPDAWQTTNIPIVPISIMPDSDSIDGNLSVKGIVVSTNNNMPHPPYLGIAGSGALGFPVPQPYDALSGWCKLSLAPGDKFSGNVRMYNNQQETIGAGTLAMDSISSQWINFTMTINYYDSTDAVNCAIYFTITDSTGLMSGHIGSYFLLDNLTLTGITGIENLAAEEDFLVFPNPVQSDLHIVSSRIQKNLFYSICDVTGKEVASEKFQDTKELALSPELRPGIYFLSIYSDERKFVKKILVE